MRNVLVPPDFDSELTLLRAVALPQIPASLLPQGVDLETLLLGAATAHLTTFEREVPEGVRAYVSVQPGDARDIIKREAAEASCVVMGAHGYSLRERFLGTTAAWVVNHLPMSILVVRAPTVRQDAAQSRVERHP